MLARMKTAWLAACVMVGAAGVLLSLGGCASGVSAEAPRVVSRRTGPLRVAVIGMSHGHVHGVLARARDAKDVEIVGVWEPDRAVFEKHAKQYGLSDSLWHKDLGEMLDACKPEAASVMTSIAEHRMAVEACAPRGVHVLVEKPLAFGREDAEKMAYLSRKYGVLVLTNFETSWYASVREANWRIEAGGGVHGREDFGSVQKMVFRHGHKGPREIGCSEEFLAWLTDPKENGGGALVDFGCYGAGLATWMMGGERPTSVTASVARLKPMTYPKVDDDATIVLTYGTATAVIEASWAWTHDNKEMDVFASGGSIHCGKWDEMWIRRPDKAAERVTPTKKPEELENEWVYLRKVVRGECAVDPLSSLENNVIVAEILDEARRQVGSPVQYDYVTSHAAHPTMKRRD